MTLKYGYLRQPFGGAKAGIRADPEESPHDRKQDLVRFAQAAAPLLCRRIYVPAPDMGTNADDIRLVLQEARIRISPRQLRVSRSGYYTALTTFHSAVQAAAASRITLAGSRAAIEGFGKVGMELGRLLTAIGVRVVAISTSRGALYDPTGLDIERLARDTAESGSRVVDRYPQAKVLPREVLSTLPVDLLFPCAGYHTVNASKSPEVTARIVCPGANNPLTEDAERTLFEREVIVLPDFVANCGGVLGSVLEFASIAPREIERILRTHTQTHVGRLLDWARREGAPPRRVAEALALRRFQDMVGATESAGLVSTFDFGMALYRAGVVPAALFATMAKRVIQKRLSWQASDEI